MSELSLTCPRTVVESTGVTGVNVDRRVFVRLGGCFEKNTPLSLESPGAGWSVSGDLVTYSGASEFQNTTQVFVNGAVQQTALSSGTGCDVFFVSTSGSQVAFSYNLDKNDTIQIWKFAGSELTTSG